MPVVFKQPAEIFPCGFSFEGKLPTGATISSAALSAIDLADNSDQTATVLQSPTGTVSGTQVLGRIRAGTHGHKYKVTFLVTLSTADVLEEELVVVVEEK